MALKIRVLATFFALALVAAKELTFEMDEHSTQCFYEDITPDVPVYIEHEVRSALKQAVIFM
jgi:hypothetical protein